MRSTIIIAVAIAALSGPALSGPRYDPAVLEQLRPGATVDEVEALTGKAREVVTKHDGTSVRYYERMSGGIISRVRFRAAWLEFGPDGRFVRVYQTSDTKPD